ncbi:TetR/AcrR family transcriptional regulator [soil metagenome]
MNDTYHHGNLAHALLDAVGEIVGEKGASGVSLREAARRAGVSHAAPAHHFGDKDGLLEAFATQGWEMLAEDLREVYIATDGDHHRVRAAAMGRAYLDFVIRHPAHYEVMMRMMDDCDDPFADLHQASQSAFAPLGLMVGQLVQEGAVEADRARYFATMMWGMVHGIAHLWESGHLQHFYEDHTPDEFLDGMTETISAVIFPD